MQPYKPSGVDQPLAPVHRRDPLTLAVAVLALVTSVVAASVASIALLGGGDDKKTSASQANPVEAVTRNATGDAGTTPPAPPTTGGPTTGPGPTSTGNVLPTGAYTRAYERQHLRVVSVSCTYTNSTEIDFDEPRVAPESKRVDAGYSGCNPGTVHSDLAKAVVDGIDSSPEDCLEKIRTQPERNAIAPKAGLTICFRTDANAAAEQGITPKIVFMAVDSLAVDSERGVMNITITAYNVPR
jgi:hypothetical protein